MAAIRGAPHRRRVLVAHPVDAVVVPAGNLVVGDLLPLRSRLRIGTPGNRGGALAVGVEVGGGRAPVLEHTRRADAQVWLLLVPEHHDVLGGGVAELEAAPDLDDAHLHAGHLGCHLLEPGVEVRCAQPPTPCAAAGEAVATRQNTAMATVIKVRRIIVMVALLAPLLSVGAASGHSCASPVQIEPGRPATVNIGVAAEDAAVVEVDVTVPSGFELDRVAGAQGWKSTVEDRVVRFSGGTIASFGCAYFSLSGTAPKRATLAFPLKVRTEAGAVREYKSRTPGAADAAQLVYAGTGPATRSSKSRVVRISPR